MDMLRATRFFLAVSVVPGPLLAAFAATTALGCAAIAVDVRYAGPLFVPILLLQLFAASSGFRVPACRGHYDWLLTRGEGRAAIAAAHWAVSAMPGVVAWGALAVAEGAGGGEALLAAGTLAALVATSTLPWALTAPLTRARGAILWLLGMLLWAGLARQAGPPLEGLLSPFALVGADLRGASAYAALGLAGIGAVSVVAAIVWVHRMDVPLESAQ
jgi:hypothetical protein